MAAPPETTGAAAALRRLAKFSVRSSLGVLRRIWRLGDPAQRFVVATRASAAPAPEPPLVSVVGEPADAGGAADRLGELDAPNIDVMIYNIVDESSFDPNFPFYIAGFFWRSINEVFNRNMVFIDSLDWANRLGTNDAPWRGSDSSLWRPYTYEGTVAHELEHLIHSDHDFDEDSWIDEGMADLAIYLNGYGHDDGHVVYYLAFHRTPLTTWGGGLENYGASYLFQLYLLENFGTKNGSSFTGWSNTCTRQLMDTQENSIAGVEAATGASFKDLRGFGNSSGHVDGQDPQARANSPPDGGVSVTLSLPFHK